MRSISLSLLAILYFFLASVHALSSSTACVSTSSGSGSISLVSSGTAAPIYIAADEWPGVYRAATDFSTDVQRVTGVTPKISNITGTSITALTSKQGTPVIIGTLGHSSLVDAVLGHSNSTQIFAALNGSWESYHAQRMSNPLPGVNEAYVIAGSDKRGTIYALYELSEQAGVSPWFWSVPLCFTTRH